MATVQEEMVSEAEVSWEVSDAKESHVSVCTH